MSFFPKCTFQYFLDGGSELVPGERNQGRLVLHVPEPIERAERLLMNLRTEAWAGYGSAPDPRAWPPRDKAGTYGFVCTSHASMQGAIVVVE